MSGLDWSRPDECCEAVFEQFRQRGFQVPPVTATETNFSIHSEESIRFSRDVIGMKGYWLNMLQAKLRLDFVSEPASYREQNNKSAMADLEFVRAKVQEWEAGGFVQRRTGPAKCCSPLSVAYKYDADKAVMKQRVVLDLSRHVNKYLNVKSVKLDDLAVSEEMLETGDFMASFDLKNQFFHVQLDSDMYEYFGFAVPEADGSVSYYNFKVLIYGCNVAVYIVTHLLLPVKAFLHKLGVKLSLYIDDGRISAAAEGVVRAQMRVVLAVLQLAGWNVQWQKCKLEPSQQLLHLGFVTDTVNMRYVAPESKLVILRQMIQEVCGYYRRAQPLPVKELVAVLGKIMALLRSHGSVMHVMSRSSQHILGRHVYEYGWRSHIYLTPAAVTELTFVAEALDEFNGQPIISAAARSTVVELQRNLYWQERVQHSQCSMDNLFVSDASATDAFIYGADGQCRYVRDFEFSPAQACVSSGHRELLAVLLALRTDEAVFRRFAGGQVYWQTDSKNCVSFLKRGSRRPEIQSDVVRIRQLERQYGIRLVPLWTPREHGRIVLADIGSKLSHSTDEWSVDRNILSFVFDMFNFVPTVDALAAECNAVCPVYYSAAPQSGSSGVNFFAQSLSPEERYFCCPPVDLIVPVFKRICAQPGVTALMLVPEWYGHGFWPVLFPAMRALPQIRQLRRFVPSFFFANQAHSPVFSRHPNFCMLALLVQS